MKTLDLFSGAGGLSAGLVRGNPHISISHAIEYDSAAAATFEQNFPNAQVDNIDIKNWYPEPHLSFDLIIGGPPCQGYSQLGKRDPKDPRNSLWEVYLDIVEHYQPKIFIMENVPNFSKSEQFAMLVNRLNASKKFDYDIDFEILDAFQFGSAQRRKRTILVGERRGNSKGILSRMRKIGRVPKRNVLQDVISDLATMPELYELPKRQIAVGEKRFPGVFETSELHLNRRYSELSLKRMKHITPGGNRFDIPDDLLPACWKNHPKGAFDVMGRLWWDKPSVTIRTEFYKPEKGRYLHPELNRALTLQEAARIQGFPDDYKWVGSRASIAKQIGNAVPLSLGEALGRAMGGY